MSDTLIVIPAYIAKKNHAKVLHKCIHSIREGSDNEILLVDDCSPFIEQINELYPFLKKEYDVSVFYKELNEGFSKTVNVGLRKALEEKRNVLLLNADIEFNNNVWLKELEQTEADIVGALLLYPNNIIQHGGIYFSAITRNFDHRFKGAPYNLPAAQKECKCPVTGALQYIKLDVLEKTGLYDEEFRLGYEDVDFMIRAISDGFKSLYNPKVIAIHHESLIRAKDNTNETHKEWQKNSLKHLVVKYQNVNFSGIAPTMMGFDDES